MGRNAGRRAALTALAALGAGCAVLGLDDPGQLERLQQAEARWAATAPGEYSFVLGRYCYCITPLEAVVVVKDGAVRELLPVAPGDTIRDEMRPYFPSVEGLFDVIRDALERADEVEVRYDEATGVPVHVAIDWIRDAVDDEVTYRVRGVVLGSARIRGEAAGGG